MAWKSCSDTPGHSLSTRCGWKRISGASNLSDPTFTTRPSGSYRISTAWTCLHRVFLHQDCRLQRQLPLQPQVGTHIAQLLLDLAHRLKVRRAVERVAAVEQELDQLSGNVAARNVQPLCQVRQRIAIVHGHDVSDAVARVDDNAALQSSTVSTTRWILLVPCAYSVSTACTPT